MTGLRIVHADGVRTAAGSTAFTLRLPDVFHKFHLPHLTEGQRADLTISDYRRCCRLWEQLTPNPPVREITLETIKGFRARLLATHQLAGRDGREATKKMLAYVRAILRHCLDLTDEAGVRLLNHVPRIPMPAIDPAEQSEPRRADLTEYARAWDACQEVCWPAKSERATWRWRTLLLLGAIYGPRRWDLIEMPWSAVTFDAACPHPHYRKRVQSPCGWLVYTPTKTKRSKGKLYLPLTPAVAEHLQVVPAEKRAGLIMGFGRAQKRIYDQWKLIWKHARVNSPYHFKDLRFSASCDWNDLWPGLGEHVTGHAARGVNARHYDQTLRRLVRFSRQLPQPENWPGCIVQTTDPMTRLAALPRETQVLLLSLADQLPS